MAEEKYMVKWYDVEFRWRQLFIALHEAVSNPLGPSLPATNCINYVVTLSLSLVTI